MPYYSGKGDQTDLYVETIDALQAVVDQYASIAPIKIIGDLNAQLPVAADHLHRQKVNYTYFCHENSTYTWIDHIICERRETTKISSCHIIPEEPGNNSDHLPVQLKYSMSLNGIKEHGKLSHNSNVRETSPN